MTTRKEIEEIRTEDGANGLSLLARKLGYHSRFGHLFEFLDDNPGAVEAVLEWVLEHGRDRDGNELEEED